MKQEHSGSVGGGAGPLLPTASSWAGPGGGEACRDREVLRTAATDSELLAAGCRASWGGGGGCQGREDPAGLLCAYADWIACDMVIAVLAGEDGSAARASSCGSASHSSSDATLTARAAKISRRRRGRQRRTRFSIRWYVAAARRKVAATAPSCTLVVLSSPSFHLSTTKIGQCQRLHRCRGKKSRRREQQDYLLQVRGSSRRVAY